MAGRAASGDEGTGGGWMFDPIANARMLAEIQARSLRAAGDLVDRLARSVDGAATSPPDAGQPTDDDAAPGMSDAARLFDVWIELLQRASNTFARSAAPTTNGHRADIDLGADDASERIAFAVDETGATHGDPPEAWLHNGTSVAIGPVALQCGELRAPDGVALAASLQFDPPIVESLPARSSRGVAICVAADADLRAGTYRAVIQADGAPHVWLPVEVVVTQVAS